jgi:hypothetical protein
MRVPASAVSSLLLVLCGAACAGDAGPAEAGTHGKNLIGSVVANRIVGAWRVNVALGPCAGGPTTVSFTAFNTFHAGGTLSDHNARPGSERSPGHGVWEHVGRGLYDTRFQFFRFLPTGALDGVQDVTQEVALDARARSYESTIRARVLNADGSPRAELCGTATGQRIAID